MLILQNNKYSIFSSYFGLYSIKTSVCSKRGHVNKFYNCARLHEQFFCKKARAHKRKINKIRMRAQMRSVNGSAESPVIQYLLGQLYLSTYKTRHPIRHGFHQHGGLMNMHRLTSIQKMKSARYKKMPLKTV